MHCGRGAGDIALVAVVWLVVEVAAVIAVMFHGIHDGPGVFPDGLVGFSASVVRTAVPAPVFQCGVACRGDFPAYVHHVLAPENLGTLLRLHLLHVGLLLLGEAGLAAPDGNHVHGVRYAPELVVEVAARSCPAAEPSETDGVVGLLVFPEGLVICLGIDVHRVVEFRIRIRPFRA